MRGVDGNDDLRLIAELEQHFHFAVRLKAGKHAGGMVIVEELAAEFQIELAAEGVHALEDPLRLQTQILFKIKSDFCHNDVLFLFFVVAQNHIHSP